MRRRTADRVASITAYDQVEIGSFRFKGIVTGRAKRRTRLPPPVLTAHNSAIQSRVEAGACAHTPVRCFDGYPIPRGNSSRLSRLRVQLHFRMQCMLPQRRQAAMLTLAKHGVLGARQD